MQCIIHNSCPINRCTPAKSISPELHSQPTQRPPLRCSRPGMVMKGMETHRVGGDVLEVVEAEVARVDGDLALHQLDDLLDALDAEDVGEHEGPAEADGTDAESEELERVGAVAHAAVGVDLELLEDLGGLVVDLERGLEAGLGGVELAAAVVGQDDGRDAVLDGQLGVLDVGDALEDDGQVGQVGELVVQVPLLCLSVSHRRPEGTARSRS
jgi:hypothetical protein